jgi:YbbR domain-containing protein
VTLARRIAPALASVLLAVVLWLIVRNLDRTPARFTVPVTYEYPEQSVILADRVNEVEVQVRATKPKLRTLQASEFTVRVRNPDGHAGRELVVLDADDVEAPFGVDVERVSPSQLVVRYEKRATRKLPVKPDVTGRPAAGHAVDLDAVKARPAEVVVAGPVAQFEQGMVVRTERLDVSGRTDDLRVRGVQLVPPGSAFVVEGSLTADVDVPIRTLLSRRTFEDVPVDVLTDEYPTSAPNPKRMRVTVEGPQLEVDALTPSQVRLVADARALTPRPADYQVEARAEIDASTCATCRAVWRSAPRVDLTVRRGRRSS